MKIGMISEFCDPHPGGISEHIRALSRELRRRGHEVTVISGGIGSKRDVSDVPVLRLGRSCPVRYNGSLSRVTIGWRLRRRLAGLLDRERFDLLHIHNPLMPTLPLLALRTARCPMVATFHSQYPRDRLTEIFRRHLDASLRRLAARLPVSRAAHRTVASHFPGSYEIVPNGVDHAFFRRAADRRRREAPPGARPPRILFIGALVPRKGLPTLLEALRRLQARGRICELRVIGEGPDRRRIERRLPPALRRAVRFEGRLPRDGLLRHLAWADIFCAPSLGRESFGIVLLEAMSAALPVVASDIAGYREVVRHMREGWLCPPGDAAALAQALDRLCHDGALGQRWGSAGQRRAREFDWSPIASRVEAVYEAVLSGDCRMHAAAARRAECMPAPAGQASPSRRAARRKPSPAEIWR